MLWRLVIYRNHYASTFLVDATNFVEHAETTFAVDVTNFSGLTSTFVAERSLSISDARATTFVEGPTFLTFAAEHGWSTTEGHSSFEHAWTFDGRVLIFVGQTSDFDGQALYFVVVLAMTFYGGVVNSERLQTSTFVGCLKNFA